MDNKPHPLSADARINRDLVEVLLADLLMTSTVNFRLGHVSFVFINNQGFRVKKEYPLTYFGGLTTSAVEEQAQRIRKEFTPKFARAK